ncbi:MAG: CPBP family intramembrane metalloprotease [Gemmatimonadetes bacterium]|nr:CPBP family intramembrane metalloprotease [Gemmatimonadota bacterium]
MTMRDYLAASRAPRYAVLFAVPLLLGYEALSLALGDSAGGVRNGADVLLKSLFVLVGGHRGLLVFNLVLGATAAWLVIRDWRRHPGGIRLGVFAGMLAESAVLALLVGIVVGRLTSALLSHLILAPQVASLGLGTQLMLSLGAGIYEELLFRVILVGALAAAGRHLLGWSARAAGTAACVIGALVFSAFHYIGPLGDPFTLASFTFRALAGLVFSALYLVRGFGITAWTHALYDVFVTLG